MGPCLCRGARPVWLPALLFFSIGAAYAQMLPGPGRCAPAAVPSQVRAEGITERVGDILLECSGLTPGAVVAGNLVLYFPAAVTNRVDAAGLATDAVLAVDSGLGFTPTGIAGQVASQGITFNGVSVTAPADGAFHLRISNVRVNAYQLGIYAPSPITVGISWVLPLTQAQVVVAYPQIGLLATVYDRGIPCVGSPLPSIVSVQGLFAAGTAFASTRLTEGFSSGFRPRGAGDDNGTRFVVRYSGFPAGTSVFVPDLVAGSDAAVPTAGGDLGGVPSAGQYVPASGTLLLARVPDADASGAGGTPVAVPAGTAAVALTGASAVALANGAGYTVYEVADANPILVESAQFPTFIAAGRVSAPAFAQETVAFGPVSSALTASATAPVMRFAPAAPPPSDCRALGDCDAGYFPKLAVEAAPVELTARDGIMNSRPGYIAFRNAGGGVMLWNATPTYQNGSGWLALDYTSGVGSASVRPSANPQGLAPGTYLGAVVIDAGPLAGNATVPVTLTVQQPTPAPAPPTPVKPVVTITAVVNAASFEAAPAVAGSLTTLTGAHLAGTRVGVTLGGLPALVLYAGEGQINLQVPAELAGQTSAVLVVTVDGDSSEPRQVPMAPAWPAVFPHGILNQDNSPNAPGSGAEAGSVVQVFATGIPTGALVEARAGDRKGLVPLYAGPAPTLPGVQQVNVTVPPGLAAGNASLVLCATVDGREYCSPPAALAVR